MTAAVLHVPLGGRAYEIHIGSDLLSGLAVRIPGKPSKIKVITDSNVAQLHLPVVLAALGLSQDDVWIMPAGEPSKSWEAAGQLLDWLLGQKLARDALLIALGGGVVGDMVGFCAAIYQRGIEFVQVPTTLLSMVDSSVGGKTGVNHARGKNMIGAFHQPIAVCADLATLQTLPERELAAGCAEVIKYGMLADAAFFAELEQSGVVALMQVQPEATAAIVLHCCQIKARIVGMDEREAISGGPRALLNLGHTFGHAVEAFAGYGTWLHGEAVGLGLLMAADLSARLGHISDDDLQRVRAVLLSARLPLTPPAGMTAADFKRLMAGDKKVAGGKLRLVLLKSLGEAVLTHEFDPQKLDATLAHFCGA